MICGIYALYWEYPSLVYIGQSSNIERRFSEHLRKLCLKKHINYKVQHAYDNFGNPELVILERCTTDQLNSLEIAWFKEFNVIEDGLNIIEAGNIASGINAPYSKYSKIQVLLSFRYLTRSRILSYPQIAKLVGVNKSLPASISKQESHIWLKDKYPRLYKKMLDCERCNHAQSVQQVYDTLPKVVDPLGNIHTVYNIRDFCKKHKLHNTHLGDVIRGHRQSHLGWTLYK